MSLDSLFDALVKHQIRFTITGSRFFGGADHNSDWDIIIESLPKGILLERVAEYDDVPNFFVYKHANINVHLLLPKTVKFDTARRIHNIVNEIPNFGGLPKKNRKAIFRALFDGFTLK
jgi:hypothetical protein